jgi:cob(I)alamin adenosyltransferase
MFTKKDLHVNTYLMPLYTKKGDAGTTKLFDSPSGVRVSKGADIFEALGTLDEVNSLIGLCKALSHEAALTVSSSPVAETLHTVQDHLFTIQAEVAGAGKSIPAESVTLLETAIAHVEAELPEIKTFFVPGSSVLSSHFDVARTVCRRAERCIVRLSEQSVGETPADVRVLSPHSLSYLNRLSSLLYALARFVAHTQGLVESAPQYK